MTEEPEVLTSAAKCPARWIYVTDGWNDFDIRCQWQEGYWAQHFAQVEGNDDIYAAIFWGEA